MYRFDFLNLCRWFCCGPEMGFHLLASPGVKNSPIRYLQNFQERSLHQTGYHSCGFYRSFIYSLYIFYSKNASQDWGSVKRLPQHEREPILVKSQFEILETWAYITKRSSSECLWFQTVVILDLYVGPFHAEVVFFTNPNSYFKWGT